MDEREQHQNTVSDEHQPHIAKVQTERRNSMGMKLVAIIVAIILILMISGRQILGMFFSSDDKTEKTEEVAPVGSVMKRQDLGKESFNPFLVDEKEEESSANNAKADSLDSDEPIVAAKQKVTFRKYLNVPVGDVNMSNHSSSGSSGASSSTAAAESNQSRPAKAEPPQVERIKYNPDLFIEEGTFIPCTLRTRFISDVTGRISCVISQNVYSASGNTVLIEAGTKATGHYKAATLQYGQSRMFIVWDNLRTPDYKKINFYNSQAVGELGEAGVDGWIDKHFWERFGNAMLLSIVQDGMAAAADQAADKDRNVDYTANSRDAMAEMAKITLEKSINIPPTIYKNQGDVIGILVGEDIDFSNVYKLKAVR